MKQTRRKKPNETGQDMPPHEAKDLMCSRCGCLTGPKGREQLGVERWVCIKCGAGHNRDANAAVNLRKLGTASAEVTRGDMAPLPACASVPASAVDEPRTEPSHRYAHI